MKFKSFCLFLILIMFLQSNIVTDFGAQAATKAQNLKLELSARYIGVGDVFYINKISTPEDAPDQTLTWSIKNVKSTGTVVKHIAGDKFKALKKGKVIITGYQKETKKSYNIEVEVGEAFEKFHIEVGGEKVTTITTYPGFHILVKAVLDYKNDWRNYLDLPFQYAIADTSIAKVNKFGEVTGIKNGSTTLTVKAMNGKAVSCKVKVVNRPEGYILDEWVAKKAEDKVGYGGYNSSYEISDNTSANPDDTKLIILPKNRLGVFSHVSIGENNHKLEIVIYNDKYNVVETKSVKLPLTIWGGIHYGTDGYFYVVVGQMNTEESNTKVVYSLIKYDSEFKELGRCDITDCFTIVPFHAGNCSIAMNGSAIVVHTSRLLYKTPDGLNHQANFVFIVDTSTMKRVNLFTGEYYHVSHSFNQLLQFDKNDLIFVEHGDAYPRAIVAHKYYNYIEPFTNYNLSHRTTTNNLIEIEGSKGDNCTGTTIGGFEIGTNNYIVAGASIPHGSLKSDVSSYYVKNVYISLLSKNGTSSKLKWLTNYKEGGSSYTNNIRLIKINEDEFAVLYQLYKKRVPYIVMKIINSKGKVLHSKEWKGIFDGNVQPVFFGNDIVWIKVKDGFQYYNDKHKQEYMNNLVRINMK